MSEEQPGDGQSAEKTEPVWSFRGYHMRPSEFNTAMVHLYRGEIARANTWRNRLDNTTNWAVIAAGAAISFALSDPSHHYGVIVLDTLLITLFLWIEARRYRYYELWSHRVRLMETDFFASMLVPPFSPHSEWAESLAETLLAPQFPISMWEAFGRRFRRNYIWIFLILAFAWALKSFLHPTPTNSLAEFVSRSALGTIPGSTMLVVGILFNGVLFAIGLATAGLHQASGEVLPRFGEIPVLSSLWQSMEVRANGDEGKRPKRPTRVFRRRQQLVALVIGADTAAISECIIRDLRRGVTALHAEGMYAQQDRDVLMVVLTVTEIAQLKAAVKSADPNAFVVVVPAREVLGRGFQPLKT
ncbi:MAG: DUF2270 domain-containing protein [Anaerolineales bacterium]